MPREGRCIRGRRRTPGEDGILKENRRRDATRDPKGRHLISAIRLGVVLECWGDCWREKSEFGERGSSEKSHSGTQGLYKLGSPHFKVPAFYPLERRGVGKGEVFP